VCGSDQPVPLSPVLNRIGHVLPAVPGLPLGVPQCPENAPVNSPKRCTPRNCWAPSAWSKGFKSPLGHSVAFAHFNVPSAQSLAQVFGLNRTFYQWGLGDAPGSEPPGKRARSPISTAWASKLVHQQMHQQLCAGGPRLHRDPKFWPCPPAPRGYRSLGHGGASTAAQAAKSVRTLDAWKWESTDSADCQRQCDLALRLQ
jgi:hypothetical protein